MLRGSGTGSIGDGYGTGPGNGKSLTITELDAGENDGQLRRMGRGNSYVIAGEVDPAEQLENGSRGSTAGKSQYFSFRPPITVNHQGTNTVDYMTSVGVQARFRPSMSKNIP